MVALLVGVAGWADHVHQFSAPPSYTDKNGMWGVEVWRHTVPASVLVADEILELVPDVAVHTDVDTCDNHEGCPLEPWGYQAEDYAQVVAARDSQQAPNKGLFGHYENGVFVEGAPFTHYKAPPVPCTVTLYVTGQDGYREYEGQWMPRDGTAEFHSDALTVWDITSPSQCPLGKYVMPDSVPSRREIALVASRDAYWGAELGDQFLQTWSQDEEPVSERTLSVTTDGNRPNDPNDGRLPDSNASFGPQVVCATEFTAESSISRQFLLFFVKGGHNHPIHSSADYDLADGVSPVPNWYYYWRQTPANSGNHRYDSSLGEGVAGAYVYGATFFRIGPAAAEGPMRSYDSLKAPEVEGIDNFAATCIHEQAHMDCYFGDLGGVPYNSDGDADQDGVMDVHEDFEDNDDLLDRNGDRLPIGYDHNESPEKNYDWDEDGVPDVEEIAIDREWSWTIHSADPYDWASPGKQY